MSTTLSTKADASVFEPAWTGFEPGAWCERIDVRDFIQRNYTPYDGDGAFLAPASERTQKLWDEVVGLMHKESEHGILGADTDVVSTITSHPPGYVDRDLEVIVGLQTDKPLKRAILPLGGIRMVESALQAYGCELSPQIKRDLRRPRIPQDAQRRRVRLLQRARCAPRASPASSPACPTPTAAAASSATTGASRSTASTACSPTRRPSTPRSPTARGARRRSACPRRPPSSTARSRTCGRWPRATDATSRHPRAPRCRRCSGCTSATWARSRSRTAPR